MLKINFAHIWKQSICYVNNNLICLISCTDDMFERADQIQQCISLWCSHDQNGFIFTSVFDFTVYCCMCDFSGVESCESSFRNAIGGKKLCIINLHWVKMKFCTVALSFVNYVRAIHVEATLYQKV